MTRPQWLLLTLITVEVALGGYLLWRHLQLTPPRPDFTAVDPITADEIRDRIDRCRTPEDWAELGEVFLATGYFPEAEACLREASARAPTRTEFAFKHAFTLERLGLLHEANSRYAEVIVRGHRRRADAWYYAGKNHLRLSDTAAAATAFDQAGDLPGARYERALLAADAEQTKEAETLARRLADEFPDAYPPVSLLYRLALVRKDGPAADRLADQFARRPRPLPTPFDTEVDWVFAVADRVGQNGLFHEAGRLVQAGRIGDAEMKLRAALAAGWNPEIADKLADVLYNTDRRQEAMEHLNEVITRGRATWDRLWRQGQMLAAQGRPAEAWAAWQRAARVATGPGARELWQELAKQADHASVHEEGVRFQNRALVAEGMRELDLGRPEAAVKAAGQAVEIAPGQAHAWFYLGEANRAAGRLAEARSAYEKCLQIDPDHGRARRALRFLAN